ncbi:beta-lactamase family protein [Acidobacteria bacterium AB60]|nr:beta-lactamase family protein [Acidobacteria bacterium AB60]
MRRPEQHGFVVAQLFLALAITTFPGNAQKSASAASPHALDMSLHSPESVGFSAERLERLHALMQRSVDDKQFAGIVTLLARHGKIVDYRTYGARDMASGAPMTKDTIFRDFSMTKPVTAVAMMILYEQGKWLPTDPIAKYVPEFAHLKVFNGTDSDGRMILVDPEHQPTMAELMSHTAGFSYGFFGDTPVDRMIRDANLFGAKDLKEFIDKLAQIPLLYQPGKGWTYSVSMDIEGYIVEKLSGKSLPDFMQENIYTPLGMKDAGFYVPDEKRDRFATNYYWDGKDGITDRPNGNLPQRDYSKPPTLASGGGGMVSTIEDYYRFAQMLANGGELSGARVLAPASVHLMTSNHLSPAIIDGGYGIGSQRIRPGFGYGYNCAVEYDPAMANLPDGKDTFLWDGAAGTWFWVDPTNDIVFIGMIQRMNGHGPSLQYLSRAEVYQALLDPSK